MAAAMKIDGKVINDRELRYKEGTLTPEQTEGLKRTHVVEVETNPDDGRFLHLVIDEDTDEDTAEVRAYCNIDRERVEFELARLSLDPPEMIDDFFLALAAHPLGSWALQALRAKAKENSRTLPGMVMELLKTALKPNQVPLVMDSWSSLVELENGQITQMRSVWLQRAAEDLLGEKAWDSHTLMIKAAKEYLKQRWERHFKEGPYSLPWIEFLERSKKKGYYGVWLGSEEGGFSVTKAAFVHVVV